jgi:hypothetical protein
LVGLDWNWRRRAAYAPTHTDLLISIMDGFKFTIRFDAWELEQIAIAHKRAPVIAVTANVTPDNVCKYK